VEPIPTHWADPPWSAPLDTEAAIEAIPAEATLSGVFLAAVADGASKDGPLPGARTSYTHFRPYPLREHARLLVAAAPVLWPRESMREGLRRLGRRTPQALVGSLIGRVVLGSVEGPLEVLRAVARSYPMHLKPGSAEVVELGPGRAVVRLREVHHFVDSHHCGSLEGALRYAEVDGRVRVHAYSRADADFLCEWTARR